MVLFDFYLFYLFFYFCELLFFALSFCELLLIFECFFPKSSLNGLWPCRGFGLWPYAALHILDIISHFQQLLNTRRMPRFHHDLFFVLSTAFVATSFALPMGQRRLFSHHLIDSTHHLWPQLIVYLWTSKAYILLQVLDPR